MLSVKNLKLNENVYQYNPKKVNEAGEVSIKKVEINNILTDTLLNADKEDIIDTLISYLSKTQKE